MLQILTTNWATEPFVIITRSCLYSRSHNEVLMQAKRNALLVVALALMIPPLAIPANAVVQDFQVPYNNTIYTVTTDTSIGNCQNCARVVNVEPLPDSYALKLTITKDVMPTQSSRLILQVKIPTQLLDSRYGDNTTRDFHVTADCGPPPTVNYPNSNPDSRQLNIFVNCNAKYVLIVGSQGIPEFPVFGLIIFAAATSFIVAARIIPKLQRS